MHIKYMHTYISIDGTWGGGAKQTVRVHSDNPLSIRSLLQNSSYALAHRCRFI